jgi:hypothetical protein
MATESVVEISKVFLKNSNFKYNVNWPSLKNIELATLHSLQSKTTESVLKTTIKGVEKYTLERELVISDLSKSKSIEAINEERFNSYLEQSVDMNLQKLRCRFNYFDSDKEKLGIKEATIDIYKKIKGSDKLNGLTIVKLIFTSVTAANKFVPPDDFGREITGCHRWTDYQMCINGVPSEQFESS